MGKEESGAIGVVTSLTTRCGNTQDDAQVGQLIDDKVSVRRLTPRECERLQGFPDNHTAVDGLPEYAQTKNGSWRAKTGTPDSRRYSAMGDAVTVNVIEWIGRRLVAVTNQPKGPNDGQDFSVSAHEPAAERDSA